jgi:hypothetical protein
MFENSVAAMTCLGKEAKPRSKGAHEHGTQCASGHGCKPCPDARSTIFFQQKVSVG